MSKDDRSPINPFTGKKELDLLNDDEFLAECYNEYYSILNQNQLLDNTPQGQIINQIVSKLINSVNMYLSNIGRLDYVQDYYDWEVHLVANDTPNAFCMPGGKIVVLSGILPITNTESDLAFILGHEISHALLDHSRTQMSKEKRKTDLVNAGIGVGNLFSLFGFGELAQLTWATSEAAHYGTEALLFPKHSREHESQADRLGMILTYLSGYDIRNIPDFWERMSESSSNDFDLFSSHPADSKRIEQMYEIINQLLTTDDIYSAPLLSDKFKQNINKNNQQAIGNNSAEKIGVDSNYCPRCESYSQKSRNFCGNCGTPVIHELKCSNCGHTTKAEDAFCGNCGKKFIN